MAESAAANPQLLADQVSSLLVQPLEAASVVLSSGPRIFDTSGVLRIPKLTKSSTVGFIGENELIPSDHDTTFDEVVLMPTERKSIKVIERYSRELARQAVIGIDATQKPLGQGRLRQTRRRAADRARLGDRRSPDHHGQRFADRRHVHAGVPRCRYVGSGVQRRRVHCAGIEAYRRSAPVIRTSTSSASRLVCTVGFAVLHFDYATRSPRQLHPYARPGASLVSPTASAKVEARLGMPTQPDRPGRYKPATWTTDADSLLDAIALASAAEVMPNRWFVNGTDFIALRKLKEATDSSKYLFGVRHSPPGPTYRLFGIPVTVTNKLPEGTAVLADVSQVAVARDEAPSVTILSERYADYDQIGIRVVTRYDLGLLHPEAVIVLTARLAPMLVDPYDVQALTDGDMETVVPIVTVLASPTPAGRDSPVTRRIRRSPR